jgi:hypothetical protein
VCDANTNTSPQKWQQSERTTHELEFLEVGKKTIRRAQTVNFIEPKTVYYFKKSLTKDIISIICIKKSFL